VPARPIERVNPIYPEKALAARVRGVVVLRAVISEAGGAPLSVTPIEKGRPDLTAAAVAAVKQWRFAPAIKDGRAVRSAAIIRIPFEAVPFARTPFPDDRPPPTPRKR
jgi:periplasmic protein TonB